MIRGAASCLALPVLLLLTPTVLPVQLPPWSLIVFLLAPRSRVNLVLEIAAFHQPICLPRSFVRPDEMHVDAEDRLQTRRVSVRWRNSEAVVITDGIARGDRIVLERLSVPVQGEIVRV